MAWTAPRTWVVGEVVSAVQMNAHIRDNLLAGFPVGKMEYFIRAATTVETLINGAWLECNGVAVSRATYAGYDALVAALSPARPFGAGNGTTTVNLPDASGRGLYALAGAGGHADVTTLAGSDGVALANRRPKHRHTPHNHDITVDTQLGGGSLIRGSSGNIPSNLTTAVQSKDGGSGVAADPLDAGAYLVAGVWAVKV